MRHLAALLLLTALLTPRSVSAGDTPTFCTDALMGACFYIDQLAVEENYSNAFGRSDYLHTLTGTWTGSALNGLTDLYWLARFSSAYDTSSEGRSVYIFRMEPDRPTQAWHDEYAQARSLRPMLWDYLSVVIYQHWGTPSQRFVARCGGGCYANTEPAIDWYSNITPEPEPDDAPPTNSPPESPDEPVVPPVSVPEPGSLLLLATGLLGIATRRRRTA